jgi:hypothetical protein
VYPFGVPLSRWFSGHISTLRETEGHKNRPIFIDVYEFVQEKGKLRTAPEANGSNPLSYAGLNKISQVSRRCIGKHLF